MNNKTIVFIVGSGHSGSTILDRLLGHHSQAFSIGEIINFHSELKNDSLCGCTNNINNCPFWMEFINNMKFHFGLSIHSNLEDFNLRFENSGNYQKFKIGRYLFSFLLLFGSLSKILIDDKWLSNTKMIYDFVFEKTGAEFIIDSSKNLNRAIVLSKMLKNSYSFKFLYLHRDGRGVLSSSLKTTYSVYLKDQNGKVKTTYNRDILNPLSLLDIIKSWKKENKKLLLTRKLYRLKNFETIKLESLLLNPEKVLTRIFRLWGLNYEEKVLEFNYGDNHMVSGNASRINAMELLPDQAGWKEGLTKKDLQIFDRIAGNFNKKLSDFT